jgi:capsular polysaccharide transport system permease protein
MSEPDSKKPPKIIGNPLPESSKAAPSENRGGTAPLPAGTVQPLHGDRAAMRAEREAQRAKRVQLREAGRDGERVPSGDAQSRRSSDDDEDAPRRAANGVRRGERADGGRRAPGEGPRRGREWSARRTRDDEDDEKPSLDEDEDAALDPEPHDKRQPKTNQDKEPEVPPRPLPVMVTGNAASLRQSRARRLLVRALLFVLLPTLAGGYYYLGQASPQFESVSLLTIYSSETIPTTSTGIDALIGLGAGSSIVTDGLSVREYVFSRDILRRLNEEERFLEHYKDQNKDWLTRIPKDASFEEAFQDYDDWVRVEVDPNSGVATLAVRAYSAEAAARFSKAIIHYAEEMVNDLSSRARHDQVKFANDTVKEAEARLTIARQALVKVQQERGEYNPELSAQAQLSIRTALESQVASARAELAQLLAYLTPDAPQVIGAKEKVRSLSAQVAGASRKMVAQGEEGESLSKSAAEFEAAVVEKEFATAAYQAAMSSLSVARASAARQHRYLATIAPPSLADKSILPNRWLGVLTVFLCSVLLMGIGSLLVAGVKEHARL